jgi:uncharacterized membrane protein YkoI
MKMTTRRALIAPIALTMTIAMSACASDDETAGSATSDSSMTSSAGTSDASSAATSGTDASENTGAPGAPAAGGAASGDTTAVGLSAIATAEGATGGVAYEIDDQDDDGTWEVDVRVGDSSIEVKLSADGTQVLEQENDDLDDDDKAGLDAASITLTDAIQKAVNHVGGTLDDAELDEGDGKHYWEVSVDTDQQDDVEVHVSVTGDIIEVDD